MERESIYSQLQLIGPRVLVRPLCELDVTDGGIVIPDTAKIPQNRAVVEKVGPGLELENGSLKPLVFAPGDVVFYQKFAGAWLMLAGKERLMLMSDEIQARLPADVVTLVTHPEGEQHEHLEGEACLICSKRRDSESKANLEAMREEMRSERQPAAAASSSAS